MKRYIKSSTEPEVLIDDKTMDKLWEALENAGVQSTDIDLAINNIWHRYQGDYMELWELSSEILSECVDAARGDGLDEEEVDAVYDYYADIIPDAVQSLID